MPRYFKKYFKKYFKMIIAGVLFFAAAVPAWSELYQYKDQNGITRLTDNIYSVPVKYRSQLEAYSEIEGLSGKMKIQPLEKKVPRQTVAEKTIVPKTDQPLPATGEKKSIPPAVPPANAPPVIIVAPSVEKSRTVTTLETKPAPEPAPDAPEKIARNPVVEPEKVAPVIDKKTVAETKKPEPEHPEPKAEIKIVQKTDHSPPANKEREMKTRGRKTITEKDESLKLVHLQTTRKSLAEKKEALNKQFLRLMEEKQALEDSVNEDDEKSVLEYNKKVKRLNIKIKQYKNEKKRLQAKIEEYNETIRQSTAN